MKFSVICPDGVNRLRTNWKDAKEAVFDAGYMSNRSSCWDWCDRNGDRNCPGGKHYIEFPTLEQELIWADLSPEYPKITEPK